MNVLISGAGIAGPTLAYWLLRHGMTPVLVERAPQLRTGGYVIDFWGAGFDVADKMDLVPRLRERGYAVNEVRVVDGRGRRVSGFPVSVFDRMAGGRYTSLPRGDLAACIYEALGGRVETLFGDSIAGIEQDEREVRVRFERAAPRSFDLVIGADGLHSKVRELAFGERSKFEKYLGLKVAAFETAGYRPRDELVYLMRTEVGQQVSRFSLRGDRTMVLFVFSSPDSMETGVAAQKALLRRRFASSGWESPQILDALDAAPDLYYDRVSQIRMPGWSAGRVALLGDAAACVSFLAGQGSALAMIEAYVLAGELKAAAGDHALAFRRYHERLAAFLAMKQKAAEGFAGNFAPRSGLELFVRNQVMKVLAVPLVAGLAFGRAFQDRIVLPDY